MTYNGFGTRMTSSALGVTTYYASDGQMPLTITSINKTTTILYGLGPIAEKMDEWNYVLSDGVNVPRQLTDSQGMVTLSVRYSPWGKPMEVSGTGNFDESFIGTLIDASTGLIYVGNGQYYDPETGRFLTRGVNPNSTNPYVPWNPIGMIFGPLVLISAHYARKKAKRAPWVALVVLALAALACSAYIPGCDAWNKFVGATPEQPTAVVVTAAPATEPAVTPSVTPPPTAGPTVPDCSGYKIPNARLVAARIYYEGASTYYTGSSSTDPTPKELFTKMVYAVKSLHDVQAAGSDYELFTRYNPAGRQLLSIANPDCDANPGYCKLVNAESFADSDLDHGLPSNVNFDAEEIVNQVLSDPSCPYAPANPFLSAPSDYAQGIHWLSPTQFPRLDVQMMPLYDANGNGVRGCVNGQGCQVPDIRERPHFETTSGALVSFAEKELIPFFWEYSKNARHAALDNQGNSECYWRGIYFFSETSFGAALIRSQQPYPTDDEYAAGKLLCQ